MLNLLLRVTFLIVCWSSLYAQAQVPHTFTDGSPAIAAQVNANFAALVSEINTLKGQIAALQGTPSAASVVGTWDIYSLNTAYFTGNTSSSIELHGGGSTGTITFNANGTFTSTESGTDSRAFIASSTQPNTVGIETSITSQSTGGSGSGTYTVSGNRIFVASEEATTIVFSADGNILMILDTDGAKITLSIAIKR